MDEDKSFITALIDSQVSTVSDIVQYVTNFSNGSHNNDHTISSEEFLDLMGTLDCTSKRLLEQENLNVQQLEQVQSYYMKAELIVGLYQLYQNVTNPSMLTMDAYMDFAENFFRSKVEKVLLSCFFHNEENFITLDYSNSSTIYTTTSETNVYNDHIKLPSSIFELPKFIDEILSKTYKLAQYYISFLSPSLSSSYYVENDNANENAHTGRYIYNEMYKLIYMYILGKINADGIEGDIEWEDKFRITIECFNSTLMMDYIPQIITMIMFDMHNSITANKVKATPYCLVCLVCNIAISTANDKLAHRTNVKKSVKKHMKNHGHVVCCGNIDFQIDRHVYPKIYDDQLNIIYENAMAQYAVMAKVANEENRKSNKRKTVVDDAEDYTERDNENIKTKRDMYCYQHRARCSKVYKWNDSFIITEFKNEQLFCPFYREALDMVTNASIDVASVTQAFDNVVEAGEE